MFAIHTCTYIIVDGIYMTGTDTRVHINMKSKHCGNTRTAVSVSRCARANKPPCTAGDQVRIIITHGIFCEYKANFSVYNLVKGSFEGSP